MSEPSINFHIQTRLTQFKIPTELIRKNFKTIQKLIEKQKKQLTDDIAKAKKDSSQSPQQKLDLIRKLIKNYDTFHTKLADAVKKDEEFRSRLAARLENLSLLTQYTVPSKTESAPHKKNDLLINDDDKLLDLHNINLINWYRNETNLLIIDYLIKSNTSSDRNIGLQLLKGFSQSGYDKLIDYDLYENFNEVFVSIVEGHDLSLVIAWFNENKSTLKKINSNLEFEINYCKFLSLIDQGRVPEAMRFSHESLSPYGNARNYPADDLHSRENNLKKIKGLGGLLLHIAMQPEAPGDTNLLGGRLYSSDEIASLDKFHDYRSMLSDQRWDSLSQCFIDNFTKIYGISKAYPLFVYLSAGLSSLKTKSCYCNIENTIFKDEEYEELENSEYTAATLPVLMDKKFRGPNHYYKLLGKINHCPVCSPELYNLSKNLPYAQLITSMFNNPFKLPNGNIYPFEKLLNPSEKYLSEKNTLLRMGKVKDPLTKEIFLVDDCVRVFPA